MAPDGVFAVQRFGSGENSAAAQKFATGQQLEFHTGQQLTRSLRVHQKLDPDQTVEVSSTTGFEQQTRGTQVIAIDKAGGAAQRRPTCQHRTGSIIRGIEGRPQSMSSGTPHVLYSLASTTRTRVRSAPSTYAARPIPSRFSTEYSCSTTSASRSRTTTRPGNRASSDSPHRQASASLVAIHLPGPQLLGPGRSLPCSSISSHSASSTYRYQHAIYRTRSLTPYVLKPSLASFAGAEETRRLVGSVRLAVAATTDVRRTSAGAGVLGPPTSNPSPWCPVYGGSLPAAIPRFPWSSRRKRATLCDPRSRTDRIGRGPSGADRHNATGRESC